MKKLIISLVLLSFSQNFFSQNNLWAIPPKLWNSTTGVYSNLPAPVTYMSSSGFLMTNDDLDVTDAYDGQLSQGASNAISDVNGNLLFFVVDGVIYNKDGVGTGLLCTYDGSLDQAYGSAETMIVPSPEKCDQYYIFSIDGYDNNAPGSATGSVPFVTLYDATQQQVIMSKGWFNCVSSTGAIFNSSWFAGCTELGSMTADYGYGSLATTKKQSNGEYYIANMSKSSLCIAKIDATGIHPHAKKYINGLIGEHTTMRTIMEIFEDPITGIKTIVTSNSDYYQQLIIVKMSADMTTLISSNIVTLPNQTTPDLITSAYIHGIEFSPNGQYVYFTHSPNSFRPETLCYIDLNNINVINPLTYNGTYNFQNSELEIRKNTTGQNELVIAHAGGLVKYTNPDAPGTGTFSSILSASLTPSYSSYYSNNQQEMQKLYSLPDQIDGMDYSTIISGSVVPTPLITANSNYCSTSMITMTGSASGTGVVASYKWIVSKIVGPTLTTVYTGPLTLGTPGSFTIPMSLVCGNDYRVSLQVQNSCGKMVSTSVTIHIDCPPTINAGPDVNICFSNMSQGYYTATFNISSSNFPVKVYKTVGGSLVLVGTYSSSPITLNSTQTTSYTFVSSPNSCGSASDVAVVNIIQNHPDFGVLQTPNSGYFKVNSIPASNYVNEQSTPGYIDSYTIDDFNDAIGSVTCYNTSSYSNSWHNSENFNGFVGTGGTASISNCGSTTEGKFMYGHQYLITRTTKNNFCPNKSTTAIVGLTQKNGKIIVIESEEIISASVENSISISPNPTNGKFNINLNDVSAEKVVVYNMLGKVVSETTVTENARSLDIDLSNLPASVYMVHVHTGSEVILKKVIKN